MSLSLRRADSVSSFLADPVGASIAGNTFVLWAQTRERIGAIHNGSYEARDAATIASLFPIFGHAQLVPRYDILHDLAGVGAFDPRGFQFFDGFLRSWIDHLAQRVRRVAVVVPSGLVGAAFTGMFHRWVAPRIESHLCETRAQAYASLDMSAAEIAAIEAEYDDLASPTTLRRLREVIAHQLGTESITTIATELGIGVRTLQRQLASLGTSFRHEVIQVRIATAKARLLACNDKVESIARTVGFASTAAFSASFHKVVGLAPTAFRARHAT